MRIRTRVALTLAAVGLGAYVWYFPPAPAAEAAEQPAKLSSVVRWSRDDYWFGGFSGLEITEDGRHFYALSDRGRLVTGLLERDPDDNLISVLLESERQLKNVKGRKLKLPRSDAEGLAMDQDGRLYVSFEQLARVWVYETPDSNARWDAYTRSWRALYPNRSLEMLAIDENGTLYTIPEAAVKGATENLVYRRLPGQEWDQPFTIPLEGRFFTVGGDFGPDGRLYVLERDVYPFGFRTRVRSFRVGERGLQDERTELETRLGKHGNLEGLSVWRDGAGRIRLTMITDNNFWPIQRNEIVEYVLTE